MCRRRDSRHHDTHGNEHGASCGVVVMGDLYAVASHQTALEMVDQAAFWAHENRDNWYRLRSICLNAAYNNAIYVDGELKGYRQLTRDEVYAIAARKKIGVSDDETYVRAHALWSTLCRVVMMQRPITCRVIRTAKSKVEKVDIKARWLALNPHDKFTADTVSQAREMCRIDDAGAQ